MQREKSALGSVVLVGLGPVFAFILQIVFLPGEPIAASHTGGFRHHPCGLGGCSLREVAERTTGAEDPPNHRAKLEHRWEVPEAAGLIPKAAFCESFLDFSAESGADSIGC